ncbi:MAG: twin-arginine translocase subunit TatC [Armatimonadota bacterium]
MAAFGLGFQLPVVLLFLARVGILNAKMMTTYWRQAVFLIVALVGIFTPTGDPMTMILMAVPMAGLYMISIVLVRVFEPAPEGSTRNDFLPKFLIALVPVGLLSAVGIWLWNINPPARADKIIKDFNTPASVKQLETKVQRLEEAAARPTTAPAADVAELSRRVDALAKRIEALEKGVKPAPVPATEGAAPRPAAPPTQPPTQTSRP